MHTTRCMSNPKVRSIVPMSSREGVLVRVKVRAGARKESFVEKAATSFEIAVKEPAEDNRANDRVRALLARHFKVATQKLTIVTGQRSSRKTIRLSE